MRGHLFIPATDGSDRCRHTMAPGDPCGWPRAEHPGLMPCDIKPPKGPVRSDLERAYERIKELEEREKENARHFQTVWDQLTELKLLRDANEGRIQLLEKELGETRALSELRLQSEQRHLARVRQYAQADTTFAANEMERVKAERDMAWDRLEHLGALARETVALVTRVAQAIDN